MTQPFVSIEEIKHVVWEIVKDIQGLDVMDRLTLTAETMELADISQWKSAPVTALLSNALRMLNNEQMKSLFLILFHTCFGILHKIFFSLLRVLFQGIAFFP